MLELVGFALVAVMILSFVGALRPSVPAGTSALFWVCAGSTLCIIIYRKMMKKKQDVS